MESLTLIEGDGAVKRAIIKNSEPKAKEHKIKWWSAAFGFALTLIMLWGVYWTLRGPWFVIKEFEIEMEPGGGQEVLFQRMRRDLQGRLKHWLGKKAWEISIEDLLASVKEDTRIQRASISRRFPNGISIRLLPRDPVLGLLDQRGQVHPVASDASLLPPLAPEEAPDLPYLRGKEFFKKVELRSKAVKFIEQIPSHGMVSAASISEIQFVPKEGFSLTLVGKGTRVLIGENDFRKKVGRIEQVLYYLNEHQIEGRVIDARFSKKVVVRLRNQP